jgi:uncharacterized protein (DUF302 family)
MADGGRCDMASYQADRRETFFDVSYASFTTAFEALLGRTDVAAFTEITSTHADAARAKLAAAVGPLDFSLFQKLDHGGILTAVASRPTRAMTYVFGNALIAVEMTKHDPRTGLYVPLRLFVQEVAPQRVLVTYDRPSAAMAQFSSPAIDEVARGLDHKVERLLAATVERARA